MASSGITSTESAGPPAPDLLQFYPLYLAAFNEHSWPDILKHVSPTCHTTVRGRLSNTSAEGMRPNYEIDFARCDKHEVAIREMKPVERLVDDSGAGEQWKKSMRWGLRLMLYDLTMKRTITVNYWYRVENGKWMQGWHEILGSVADEEE